MAVPKPSRAALLTKAIDSASGVVRDVNAAHATSSRRPSVNPSGGRWTSLRPEGEHRVRRSSGSAHAVKVLQQ
jgi:hypothetical protein